MNIVTVNLYFPKSNNHFTFSSNNMLFSLEDIKDIIERECVKQQLPKDLFELEIDEEGLFSNLSGTSVEYTIEQIPHY